MSDGSGERYAAATMNEHPACNFTISSNASHILQFVVDLAQNTPAGFHTRFGEWVNKVSVFMENALIGTSNKEVSSFSGTIQCGKNTLLKIN